MKTWTHVRFSAEEVASGVVARLMRDLMPLALEIHNFEDIGVFCEDLDSRGKCLYFSPGASKAFASALGRLPAEPCAPPNAEAPLLLYGARECLLPPPKDLADRASPRILRLEELIE